MNTRPAFEWLVSQFDVERLGWVLLHSLWQFTLVTLLAAAVVRTLRRKSSALRYGVLVTSMTVSVTAPAVTLMLLPNDRPLPVPSHDAISPMQHVHDALEGSSLPLESEAPSVEMPIAASDLSIPELQPAEPVQSPAVRQPGPPWSERASMALRPWLAWIVVAWSLGVVICSARPLLGWRTLRRLRRVGVSPVPDEVLATLGRLSRQLGLPNTVQLLQSTLAQMPIVVGYFRPVILLPVSLLTSVPAIQLEALLVHELAHIRQHDFVVNLLQVVAETLFFYHPALWWLSRQIRIEREHSCDDLVVQLLGNRVEYGRALVAVEQLRGRVSALALSAGGGTLLSRIRRLGSGPAVESRRLAWCGSIAAILACFIGCTLLFSSTLDRLVKTECARVALPDGSSVALLGVTSDGTDPARWWSADGKPLDGHPLTGHRTTSQPDWGTRRRFAVRSTRSKRVAWFFPSDGEYQSSGSEGDGPDYLREEVIAPLALPSLDPIAVECGVGEGDFGPWSTINLDGNRQPVSETSPELTPFYEQITQQASFVFVENGAEDVTLAIPTYKYIADQEWVVIAKDGRRLPWRVRSEIFSSKYEITFSVPPDGIDHVEFRLRPYRHWVTFKNVSLRRGQITDVKVATAPPHPEAKASSESDPSDGASQRPPFVVTVLTQRKRDKKEGDELRDNEPGLINEGGDLIKGFGTGIVIDERGYIATMRHLVSDSRTVRVMLSGYRTYDARIVASDVKRGIAVLKIDPPQPLETAKFGTSSTLKKSDSVAIFDGSQGQGSQAAKGSVTELGQLVEVNPQVIYSNLIQTDIPIDPGQSGGPLMNASGEVIGIMVALRTGTQKVSFALPVDDLLPVFKQIVEADAGTARNEKVEAAQGDQTFNAVKEEAQRDIADGRLKFKLYGQLSDPDRKLLGEQGIGIEVLPRNITSDDKKRANFYNQVILDHVVAQLGAGAQADHMRAALNKPNEQLIEQAPDDRSSQEAKVHSEEQEPVVRRPLSPTLVFPDHLNVVAVGFDREGAELVSLSTENDVAVRAWEPDIILRAWGSDRKKPKREVKLDTAKHGNIFLQGQPMLSGDRRHVIAILDRQVTIWDANTGKLVKTLGPPQEMQNSVLRNLTATPDLALVACGRAPGFSGIDIADADAIVWDVAAGRVLRTVSHAKALQIQSVALSPDGKFLATGGQESGLCLWDLGTGKLLYQLPNENAGKQHPNPEVSAGGANQVLSLRFSPDGKQLALGDMLGVKMLEASTGKLLFQCEAPFRYGRSGFVFSKDGQMFARIATDKTVPIWSARTGTLLAELPTESHDGTFSGDNRSLVVGFTDSKLGLAVWPLVSGTAKPNTNSMNATPLQRLVAQFSSGHRIEFVGMTRNTLSAKSGWRPDGQAMGDVPEFKATLGGRRANGDFAGTAPVEDENARDFLFEFRGLRDEPSVHFELPFGTPIYAQEPIRDSHLRIRVFAGPQDKKHPYSDPASPPQPHKLRVGLTDEPWGPWQQISATGQLLNNLGKNKLYQSHYLQIGFRIGSGGGFPDDTLLVFRHPQQHDRLYAFEMRAIDTEGEVVRGLDWRRQDVEGTALEDSGWYLTQPLPQGKKLARFEYRLRPYRDWVTFENVSLVPGQQTDVKVTTDSLPEDKPRAAIEAVEPARDATNDPDPKTDQPKNGYKTPRADPIEEPEGKPRPDSALGSGNPRRAQVRILTPNVKAREWPQWGGTIHRNNIAVGQSVPVTWNIETRENIKWSVPLGSVTFSSPVIANGKVFIGTNNGHGYVKEHPAIEDVSCLLAFDEASGKFLWQASNLKLPAGRTEDWPNIGICSTPYCEGDRVWYVTNRAEVMCLDAEGFHDGKNDGPLTDERLNGPDHADIVWRFDMMAKLGIKPHHATNCSVTCLGDRLFVVVSSGVDSSKTFAVQPKVPSFVCLDKRSGQLLWSDDSASGNVLECHWSSPCVFEAGGQWQVVMGGGDGWVYSFDLVGDGQGRAKLLWKFDTNPKESIYMLGRGTRNYCVATPVFYDGHVYIGNGQDPEKGEGIGHLYCIDPTKLGDVSAELAVDAQGKPLASRRLQAVDVKQGEKAIPNPNSAMVWHYSALDRVGPNKPKFEESFHRTVGSVAIADDLLFVADFSGLLHCLDAKKSVNGQPVVHWTHDLLAACWSTPLIADGKVFIANEDGNVAILRLSAQKTVLAERNVGATTYSTPAVANHTLFLAMKNRLLAITDPNVAARAGVGSPESALAPAADLSKSDAKTDQPNNTNKPQISESVEEPDDKPRPLFGVWGPKANGLRARIIPVQSSIQDEALKVPQRVTKFATVEDVAFVVELQNVSDQPIKLVDVWRDVKTETPIQDANWLSQFVCSVVLINRNGTWIETADVEVADAEFVLHDAQVRTLQPGTTYHFLIKPTRWLTALRPQLLAGPCRVAVSYRWPAGPHAAKISEANPGKKFSEVAPISIVAGAVEIEVGGENRQPDLVWGEAVNGLRAALSFKTSNATHSHGERLDVRLHLQNVSTQRLKLVSDLSQPVTAATIKDELVQKVNKVDEDDGGLAPSINGLVTLGPQQIVVLDAGNIGLAGSEEQASRFDDKTVRKLIAPAGKYSMQLETSFKNVLTQRIVVPGQEVMRVQDAWTGKLKTGATPLVVEEGKKNAAAKQVVEVRLVGGPKSEPLPNVKVEFTTGHGGDRISLGSFTTDDAGQLKAELPVGFYYLHLSSEKEWPFLPFEKNWTGSSFGHSKELNIHVTEQRVEKWIDGQRCERGFEAATKERSARITFTLEPAVEFVLRAVDIETGQGIPGAEFYEESAAAEDWAHRIYGENIGSKFASSTKSTPASDDLTDNEGYLRRWVGERSAESTFGVQKPPKGYKLIEPKAEVALPTKLGQSRAEQVFRFCRIRWDVQVEPEKKKFVLGTPISLTFTVINRTNEACGLELGSEHKHQLGRRDAIEIAVINNDSKQLPIPEPAAWLDGITRPELLVPNGEAKATLLLSDWATITQPGTYRVFVKQKLKLFPIKSQQNGQIKWSDTPEIAAVEASCELEVITPVAAQFDLLQGEWALKAWQEEGVEESVYASADELKGKKLLINGNVMSGVGSGIGGSMSFKLNSEKTPNEIDLTVLDGKRKGITEPGIYKIEGDQLRICFGGKIRPKEFATTPGSGHTLLTLQKESLTAWGNEVGGLQAGLGFRPGEHRVYHPGEAVKLVLRVRNVGKEAVEFKHIRAFFIENPPKITDADGKIVELPNYRTRDQESHTARSNNVLPGEEVDLHEWAFDLQPKIEHSSRSFIPGTGQFSIQCGRIVGPTWLNPNHPNPTSDKLATGMLKLEVKDAKKLSDAPPKEPPTAWGKEAGGLQAGLSISNASDVRIGGKVTLVLKLRNVRNDPITTSAWPLWLIKPTIVDGAGKQVRTTSPSSPGFDLSTTDITLKPGQTVVVATNSIFVVDAEAKGGVRHEGVADQFTINVHPGRHRIDLKGFLEGRPTVATGTVEFEVKADKQEKPDAPAAKPNNDPANDEKPEEKPQEPGAKQELPMPSEAKLRVEGVDKRMLAALIARKENDGIPVVVEVTDFKVVEKFDAKLFEQP